MKDHITSISQCICMLFLKGQVSDVFSLDSPVFISAGLQPWRTWLRSLSRLLLGRCTCCSEAMLKLLIIILAQN